MMRETDSGRIPRPRTTMLATLAIALTLGAAAAIARGPEPVQAKATAVVGINPDVCAGMTASIWNRDSNGDTVVNAADATYACNRLNVPAMLADLAGVLGGSIDNPITYSNLTFFSGSRLQRNTGKLWILAFVSNDDLAYFDTDTGIFASSGLSTSSCPFSDADCDQDFSTPGDGVVVDQLLSAPTLGTYELTVTQSGIDTSHIFQVVLNAAVGGIAEAPDADASSLETTASGGPSRAPYLAIAGAAAGVVVLGAGAFYAGRRRQKA